MKIVLSIILLSTALLFAQEPAPDGAATREDVLQLFSIMQINQQMHTMMDAMMKQQKSLVHDTARRKNPNINQQELDRLDRMMDETIKDFPVIMVDCDEWDGLLGWLSGRALADHRIDDRDLAGIHRVSRAADVVRIVGEGFAGQRALRWPTRD